jgi:hypothetical protein
VNALIFTAALLSLVTLPLRALAQPSTAPGDDERERKFVEALQREDPASAERYVTLRDARAKAAAELQRAETQYRAAGTELGAVFLSRLKQAQRQFAESSLALLDFLEARDRRALAIYQQEISRINRLLEEHEQRRAEFKKLLSEP